MFLHEYELTDFLISNLSMLEKLDYSVKDILVIKELSGLFGRPDIVTVQCNQPDFVSMAIEFKLRNWKRALTQAYRYKSFSNYSIVILDEHYIRPALLNLDMFIKANIGLCGLSDVGQFKVYQKPFLQQPYSNPTRNKFLAYIKGLKEQKTSKSIEFKNVWKFYCA